MRIVPAVELEAGRSATIDHVVEVRHCAPAVGSGDVEVLSTPVVLAWCESACMAAIADEMDPTNTTVGMRVRLDHLRASPVGATVTVRAELSRVEGRRFTFDVSAHQGDDEVAHGQVVRVLVDRSRFLDKARQG